MIPPSVSLTNTSTNSNNQPENCRDWVESRLGFRETEDGDKDLMIINTTEQPLGPLAAHKR